MVAGPNAWWDRAEEEVEAARLLDREAMALQAYHHAGQAVEFALKAIYMRRRGFAVLPEECRGANWHSLVLIADRAGLRGDIYKLQLLDRSRHALWSTVLLWDSNARFPGTRPDARHIKSVTDAALREPGGVMAWLRVIFRLI